MPTEQTVKPGILATLARNRWLAKNPNYATTMTHPLRGIGTQGVTLALYTNHKDFACLYCRTCGETLMEEYTPQGTVLTVTPYQLVEIISRHELTCIGYVP